MAFVKKEKLVLRVEPTRRRLSGYAEVSVVATSAGAAAILRLNCRQCRVVAVEVDGAPAHFVHSDLLGTIVRENYADLDAFYMCHRAALDAANKGELAVHMPDPAAGAAAADGGVRVVRVWYELIDPTAGVTFGNERAKDGSVPVCMYTHEAPGGSGAVLSGGGGARAWFPCVDLPGDAHRCPFEVEITVPIALKAVASGALKKRVEGCVGAVAPDGVGVWSSTSSAPALVPPALRESCALAKPRAGAPPAEPTHATFVYAVARPIPARALGLAVGAFGVFKAKLRRKRVAGGGASARSHGGGGGGLGGGGGVAEVKTVAEHYYLPSVSSDEIRAMKQVLDGTVFHAIRVAEAQTNAPYPFETETTSRDGRRTLVETHRQVFVSGGIAHGSASFATLTIMNASDLYDGRTCDAPTERVVEAAQQRGVAAQWFLAALDVPSWEDAWVLEGLTGLLAAKTAAQLHLEPPTNFPRRQRRFDPSFGETSCRERCRAICDVEDERARLGQQRPLAPAPTAVWQCVPNCPAGDELAALKAPYVMRMLEAHVGTAAFWSKLRGARLWGGGSGSGDASGAALLSTEDLLHLVSRHSRERQQTILKVQLAKFARQWIYGTGYPVLTVRCTYNRKKKHALVEVRQHRGARGRAASAKALLSAMPAGAATGAAPSSASASSGSGTAMVSRRHRGGHHQSSVARELTHEARVQRDQARDGLLFCGALGVHLAVRKQKKPVRRDDLSTGDVAAEDDAVPEHELVVRPDGKLRGLEVGRVLTVMEISVKHALMVRKQTARGKGKGKGGGRRGDGGGPAKKKPRRGGAGGGAFAAGSMAAPMARSITLQAQQQEDINDTPLLWMRVDPHFLWLRRIVMELPTENSLGQIMLRDQLRWRGGEKGGSCANCDAITAQRARRGSAGGFAMWSAKLEALDALAALPRPGSDGISGGAGGALNAIKECACDVSEDIRVRVAAVQALATWQNNHAPRSSTDGDDERSPHTSWAGSTALRSFFKSEWFVDGDKDTPLANAALFARDASQLSHVELKKATACAIGRVRAGDGYALVEDARFLLNVLKNNDNTGSAKRDDYLHAALIDAVASAAAHLRSRRAARRGRAESCASCSDSEEESGAGSAVALRARVRDAGDERESERCEATLNEVVQVLRTKLHFDQIEVGRSYKGVVGAACIRGLAELEANHPSVPRGTFMREVASVVTRLCADAALARAAAPPADERTAAVPVRVIDAVLWGVATTLAARAVGGSTRLDVHLEGCRNSFTPRLLPQQRDAERGIGAQQTPGTLRALGALAGSALDGEAWIERAHWLLGALDSPICADLSVRYAAQRGLLDAMISAQADEATLALRQRVAEHDRRREERRARDGVAASKGAHSRRGGRRRGVELLRSHRVYPGAKEFASALWTLLNKGSAMRAELRVHAVQLYRALFGGYAPFNRLNEGERRPLAELPDRLGEGVTPRRGDAGAANALKPKSTRQPECFEHYHKQRSIELHPRTAHDDNQKRFIFQREYPVIRYPVPAWLVKPPLGMKIRLKEVRRYKEHRLSDMRDEVRDLLEMQRNPDSDYPCSCSTTGLLRWRAHKKDEEMREVRRTKAAGLWTAQAAEEYARKQQTQKEEEEARDLRARYSVHSAGWRCVPLTMEDERKLRQQQEEMFDAVETGRTRFMLTHGASRASSPVGGNDS